MVNKHISIVDCFPVPSFMHASSVDVQQYDSTQLSDRLSHSFTQSMIHNACMLHVPTAYAQQHMSA